MLGKEKFGELPSYNKILKLAQVTTVCFFGRVGELLLKISCKLQSMQL